MGPAIEEPHERLAWAREQAGFMDKTAFAKAVGVHPTTYRAYENGQNGFARQAAAFGRKLGVSAEWLLEGGPVPVISKVADRSPHGSAVRAAGAGPRADRPEQPSARSVGSGETASIMRLDLSYSMGPGTDLDASYYTEGEPYEFDLGFLRGLTITPPNRIRIVDGVGDSMQPTLHDRELLFIDINQRELNAQDRIWAIALFGVGAVKRLRVTGADTVLVISDNPDIGNQEVQRKDISIHGRVVGSIKRH